MTITNPTIRAIRTGLLGLALTAGLATEGLANIPHALPLSGRIEAAPVQVREAGTVSLAYAAPAIPSARGLEGPVAAEAPTTVETAAPPAHAGAIEVAPRKACPARSWPNLAARCFADADVLGGRS